MTIHDGKSPLPKSLFVHKSSSLEKGWKKVNWLIFHPPDDEGPCATKLEKISIILKQGAPISWIPTCDDNGDFHFKQCSSRGKPSCWCAHQKTGEKVPGSQRGLPQMLKLKCGPTKSKGNNDVIWNCFKTLCCKEEEEMVGEVQHLKHTLITHRTFP